MAEEYPIRPKMSRWFRYPCIGFGVLMILEGVMELVQSMKFDIFKLLAAFLVGSAWLAFGLYGGLPLLKTVRDWHPMAASDEINTMHREGLLSMRRRRWIMWASVPCAFAIAVFLIPLLMQAGQPGLIVIFLGVPLAIISSRYLLCRCPRCGYGFFTRSKSRVAAIKLKQACGHCGLSLDDYKDHKA